MDPALTCLFYNNDAPTDYQIGQIEYLLDAGETELADISDAITKLSLVVSRLEILQKYRARSLVPLRRVLSTVRRIPPEILADIFLCCRDNSAKSSHYSVTDAREAPLLLARVSSHWRNVVHNTPGLWDTVSLSGKPHFGVSAASLFHNLLSRSPTLPLTVSLTTPTKLSLSRQRNLTSSR
ncbi:hypothetical protein DFH07DRAFT_927960, partial [Mycena maculata]